MGNKNYFESAERSSYRGFELPSLWVVILLWRKSRGNQFWFKLAMVQVIGIDCNFSFVSFLLVVQLVKSKDNIKRLRLKIESKTAKDFEFDDGKVK